MGFRLLFFILVLFVIELYAFQAFKTVVKGSWFLLTYVLLSVAILVFIVYGFFNFDRSVGQTREMMFTMGLLLIVYVPKMILTIVLLGEDVYRVIMGSINYFVDYENESFLTSRRKFVSQFGLGLAALPFCPYFMGLQLVNTIIK